MLSQLYLHKVFGVDIFFLSLFSCCYAVCLLTEADRLTEQILRVS